MVAEETEYSVGVVKDVAKAIIDDSFLFVTPSGDKYDGFEGFARWCKERKMDVGKTAKLYEKMITNHKKI